MKPFFFLIIALLTGTSAPAQDIIYKMSGDEIKAKVVEITLTDIGYKLIDSLYAIPRTIPKQDVFMIKYANGAKELFGPAPPEPATTISTTATNPRDMYEKGRQDGRKYYRGTGALVGSAFGGLASIFVPITIAAIPPNLSKINIPDKTLLLNPDYRAGLQRQAHRKKVGQAATGTGIALAVGAAVFIALVSSM